MSEHDDNHGHVDSVNAGGHGHSINAHTDALLPDPGLHDHYWRPTDVDVKAEKRAERQVAALFFLSMVCTALFVTAYVTLKTGVGGQTFIGLGASNVALGLSLGFALLFIGVGIIQWARKLMADVEIAEERHPASSSDEDRAIVAAALAAGLEESGIGRRPLIRNTLLASVGLLVAPAIVMLRDLGPLPGDKLKHTVWARNMRVVRDVMGTPIRPGDLEIGDLVNAQPEIIFGFFEGQELAADKKLEGVDLQDARAKSATVLLRMVPSDIKPGKGRENWDVDGIVAYSKICTHVGCPISLNERTTHHLLCPCHQSTFDLSDSGKVVFGPAGRHLPQLPLGVDADGYLVARSDYPEPVGPSFWERNTKHIGDMGEADIPEIGA